MKVKKIRVPKIFIELCEKFGVLPEELAVRVLYQYAKDNPQQIILVAQPPAKKLTTATYLN